MRHAVDLLIINNVLTLILFELLNICCSAKVVVIILNVSRRHLTDNEMFRAVRMLQAGRLQVNISNAMGTTKEI